MVLCSSCCVVRYFAVGRVWWAMIPYGLWLLAVLFLVALGEVLLDD